MRAAAEIRPGRPVKRLWSTRLARGLGALAIVLLLGAAVATAVSWRAADPALYPPAPGDRSIPIEVVSNGFHSGLALPRTALAEAADRLALPRLAVVAARFAGSPVLEIGWGEARFYRATPTVASMDWGLALSALFRPGNAAVIHVAGLPARAERALIADTVSVALSPSGFDALSRALDASFAGDPGSTIRELGPGLSQTSLFYDAVGTFSVVHLCNHWTSDLLATAGLPTVRAWATLPDGLLLALSLRAGLPVHARSRAGTAG